MNLPLIPNRLARRVFLDRHALATPPSGPAHGAALRQLIDRIGFVQIDSIATVERAHHMILFARRQSYRPTMLAPLLERDRHLWEHWTHDASILPIETFRHWHHRFAHNRAKLVERWTGWQKPGFEHRFEDVLDHIRQHGPVSAAELADGPREKEGPNAGWWNWHPSKAALEFLWQAGDLSITRRDAFRKVYDLTERVIPAPHRGPAPDLAETVDWACRMALARLGFATAQELAAYWRAVTSDQARDWCQQALSRGEIVAAEIEGWDGVRRKTYVAPEVLTTEPPEPPGRVRVLSPFDPMLRNRKRAEFLFGFFYRIEIYVPEPKRQYGYYVFPLLEGDRVIGRLDAKAHRDLGILRIKGFWPEPGIRLGAGRLSRLKAELERLAVFAGCSQIEFLPGWDRSA